MPINPIFLPADVLNPIQPPAPPSPPAVPSIEAPEVPVVAAKKKPPPEEVVLVSGVNYPHKRGKIHDGFSLYCKRIAPKLHKKYPAAKITVFNFFSGTQEEYQFKGTALAKPKVVTTFGALDAKNYRFTVDKGDDAKEKYVVKEPASGGHTTYFPGISDIHATKDVKKTDYLKAFKKHKLKEVSISIRDVYEYIESLGKSAKGSLKELHVFSHAWIGGPILANSREYFEPNVAGTSVWLNDSKFLDKDGRPEDFDTGYTVLGSLPDFKAAFAKDTLSMIWGCNAYASPKQIVNQTINSKHFKAMVKDPGKKLLELVYNSQDWGEDTEDEFHELVLDKAPYTTGKKSEKKSLKDIIKILKKMLDGTYMKALAKGSGNQVLGALPGTYANLDQRYQTKFGLLLMHVPLGKKYKDYVDDKDFSKGYVNFLPILKFYHDHLAVSFKPDGEYDKKTYGRGYAAYGP